MADVAPVPFINFGLSQQQQAQAGASANLENQQAAVANQQAQQQGMATDLLRQSMPLYHQTIANMISDMSGTTTANAMAPTQYKAENSSGTIPGGPGAPPENPQAQADTSGVPDYADPGKIAESVRAANYVAPFTPQEQKALLQGAVMAGLPGPAANPAYLNMAKMQNQFRIANQSKMNQLRSNQLYDVLTAVQDPDNQDPLGMLRAAPGQQAIVAQIVKDHPGDVPAQQEAARKYAQMAAFNLHQYTGSGQTLQNGVLVDTTRGTPVTGQDQVLTGLTTDQKSKVMQWAQQPIPVKLNTGETVNMPREKAPVDQGGIGMSAEAYVARQNALALRHMNDPTQPEPGTNSWNAPTAVGNTSGAQNAKNGNAVRAEAPTIPAGAHPATGAALATARGQSATQSAANAVPSPTTALRGPVPPTGTPAYNNRLSAALNDPTYKARWNITAQPGLPIPGAKEGVTQYQTQRNELLKEASDNSQAADQALQNFRAAKMIFDSNTPLTGSIGALEQKVAATLGLNWQSPAARQEVAKYLVNGAISGLKQTYGARPGVFDVKINVEQAFPNIDKMSPPAVRNLIDSQISQAQYIKDSGLRAKAYAGKGLEPNSFSTWNSTYFPRAELLDTAYGSKPTPKAEAPAVGVVEKGYKFLGGDPSKPTSWQKVQ